MIKQDEEFRKEINSNRVKLANQHSSPPTSIQIPASDIVSWEGPNSAMTPRANGTYFPAMTPGMNIGVATPAATTYLPGVPEDGTSLGKRTSHTSRNSTDKPVDYFSNAPSAAPDGTKPAVTPGELPDDKASKSPLDADKENNGKESGTLFGKKFRMGMSFGGKKLGRSASTSVDKPVVVDERAEDSEDSEPKEKEVDDNLNGVIQTIRNEYEKLLLEQPDQNIESGITPSLPNETPVLKPPPMTTVIIQEETSGGSADLYRGTVATVGEDASQIEQHAPMWLGDLLLRV
jgi:WD repeat-containing protein 48